MKKFLRTAVAFGLTALLGVNTSAAMFTDVDSYTDFTMDGEPVYAVDDMADVGDYWTGSWNGSGDNGDIQTVEIVDGAGYNGTKGIAVSSDGNSNVGMYFYATDKNGISTDYSGAKYLRIWMDFSEVEFRKACFGVVDQQFNIFSTDEVDETDSERQCPFYYSEDGKTWTEFMHGSDNCFGDAQDTPVLGLKGWFAFPLADFTVRANANWEGYEELTPCDPSNILGVYMFWDYSDNVNVTGTSFILDNIEFVEDYTVLDLGVEEAPVEEPAAEDPAPVEEPVPMEDPAPVEESAAETVEVVENPAAPVETVAPAVVETAPQTFDFGVTAVVAAVLSLVGFAVCGKREKR